MVNQFSMDMSEEKEYKRRMLLPQGWRKFEIVSCKESESKAGNNQFIFEFKDKQTEYIDTVYAIAIPKKRWMLKQILTACKVSAGEDGKYNWDIPDVLNKTVKAFVDHEPNEYTNRAGETVKTTQHKIVEVKAGEEEGEKGWDDDQ